MCHKLNKWMMENCFAIGSTFICSEWEHTFQCQVSSLGTFLCATQWYCAFWHVLPTNIRIITRTWRHKWETSWLQIKSEAQPWRRVAPCCSFPWLTVMRRRNLSVLFGWILLVRASNIYRESCCCLWGSAGDTEVLLSCSPPRSSSWEEEEEGGSRTHRSKKRRIEGNRVSLKHLASVEHMSKVFWLDLWTTERMYPVPLNKTQEKNKIQF